MNRAWTRSLKSIYRKEPLSSFLLTAGAVNAIIGGVDSQWTLMALGLSAVTVAIGLRWWIEQQRQARTIYKSPIRYLPDRSSRPSLPSLTPSKKQEK
jgi:Flp pilus assembly protein TadB